MIQTWYVIFLNASPLEPNALRRDHWLDAFLNRLKPGFRHVFAMRRAENFDGWVILDPALNGINVTEIENQEMTIAGQKFANYAVFVEAMIEVGQAHHIRSHKQPGAYWKPRGLFSCFGVVKHLLALEAPFVWTPWQLYKYLGGQVLDQEVLK